LPLQMFHHPPYHDATTTIRMNQQVVLRLHPYSYYQSTTGPDSRILNASPSVPTHEAPNAAALPLQVGVPQPPSLHNQPLLQTTSSAKRCFDEPPYYCPKFYEYCTRKAGVGQSILGKPPHNYTCPSLSSPFSFLDPNTTGTI
jgi:hypothetical protein